MLWFAKLVKIKSIFVVIDFVVPINTIIVHYNGFMGNIINISNFVETIHWKHETINLQTNILFLMD